MKFKFIGKDGSLGLRKGAVYTIRTSIQNNLLWVNWGNDFCPYRNLEAFFRNWERSEEK